MKILIKSGYIHYGYQVKDKEISVTQEEIEMIQSLNVKYEIVKEEPKYKRKEKSEDDI
jgi:hypothetical protein